MSDQRIQLLLAARHGDQFAAGALWHRYAARLVAYSRAILGARGGEQDAEDVVQSAFCRVLAVTESELSAVRDLDAWLAQIARRTSLNWLRTNRRDAARREHIALRPRNNLAAASDPDLAGTVDGLPVRLREVIVLRHVGGLTFDQIELATGINRNTAAARYRSAIAHLRESLDPVSTKLSHAVAATPRQNLVHHD